MMRPSRFLAATAVAVALSMFSATAARAEGPTLLASGSSFVGIMVDYWRSQVARDPLKLKINYQASGSSTGRNDFKIGRTDFGISDIAYDKTELTPDFTRPFVYIPIIAGGLAFMYNLTDKGKQVRDLRLTPRTACRIFTGQANNWNDPDITADNGGRAFDSQNIKPVARSDGSGTSFVLGEYCIDQAPDVYKTYYNQYVGPGDPGPVSNFPNPTGTNPASFSAPGSDGIADAVNNDVTGKGAITAVETGFAIQRNRPTAAMKNTSGRFVNPSCKIDDPNRVECKQGDPTNEEAVTNALKTATVNADQTHFLDFRGAGDNVYNPSTYSYLIAQTDGFDQAKGKVLAQFLYYDLLDGQKKAPELGYSRLPDNLVAIAIALTKVIPGAPEPPAGTPALPPGTPALVTNVRSITGNPGARSPAAGAGPAAGSGPAAGTGVSGAQLGALDASPAVAPAVGPVASTGPGDALLIGAAGLALLTGGELVLRRTRRRRPS